jgi:hypothetical protein
MSRALIEAERSVLLKSLQDCGLRVDSVEIGSQLRLAPLLLSRSSPTKGSGAKQRQSGLRSGNARWRAYTSPAEEEPDSDNERVDSRAEQFRTQGKRW